MHFRLLQLPLQFRRGLAILPMATLLAIPMHLLAIAATVAIGTTPTAELAVLSLESGTTSSTGISQQAKFAEIVYDVLDPPTTIT